MNESFEGEVELTSNGMGVAGGFAACDEDNIPLTRICVLVLEKEEVVDAVVAKGRSFDHHAEGTSKLLFNNEILLATDLGVHAACQYRAVQRRAQTAWT